MRKLENEKIRELGNEEISKWGASRTGKNFGKVCAVKSDA